MSGIMFAQNQMGLDIFCSVEEFIGCCLLIPRRRFLPRKYTQKRSFRPRMSWRGEKSFLKRLVAKANDSLSHTHTHKSKVNLILCHASANLKLSPQS